MDSAQSSPLYKQQLQVERFRQSYRIQENIRVMQGCVNSIDNLISLLEKRSNGSQKV